MCTVFLTFSCAVPNYLPTLCSLSKRGELWECWVEQETTMKSKSLNSPNTVLSLLSSLPLSLNLSFFICRRYFGILKLPCLRALPALHHQLLRLEKAEPWVKSRTQLYGREGGRTLTKTWPKSHLVHRGLEVNLPCRPSQSAANIQTCLECVMC